MLDHPFVWSGVLSKHIHDKIKDFLNNTPGARTALQVVDVGLMIAGGPVRLIGRWVY